MRPQTSAINPADASLLTSTNSTSPVQTSS
jgi:hypothetical protein